MEGEGRGHDYPEQQDSSIRKPGNAEYQSTGGGRGDLEKELSRRNYEKLLGVSGERIQALLDRRSESVEYARDILAKGDPKAIGAIAEIMSAINSIQGSEIDFDSGPLREAKASEMLTIPAPERSMEDQQVIDYYKSVLAPGLLEAEQRREKDRARIEQAQKDAEAAGQAIDNDPHGTAALMRTIIRSMDYIDMSSSDQRDRSPQNPNS